MNAGCAASAPEVGKSMRPRSPCARGVVVAAATSDKDGQEEGGSAGHGHRLNTDTGRPYMKKGAGPDGPAPACP